MMEKALEILKEIKNQKPFIYRLTSVWCRALIVNEPSKLDEAIAELEALQLKNCLSCASCNKDTQLMSCPPQYTLSCGVFSTVFVNDFKQSCSRYEAKDNA